MGPCSATEKHSPQSAATGRPGFVCRAASLVPPHTRWGCTWLVGFRLRRTLVACGALARKGLEHLIRKHLVGAGHHRVTLTATLVVIVGAASLLGGCDKPSAASKASSLIQDGVTAGREGNSAAALADYQAAVTADPLSAIAYYDLGVAYGERDDVDQARTSFQKALLINPRYKSALFDLAVLDTPTEPTTAETLYRQLDDLYPNSPNALFNLGLLLDHLGNKAGGAAAIAKAVALEPSLASRLPKPAKPTKPASPTTSTTKAP